MLKINEYFYHLKGKDLFVHKNHSHNEIEFIQVISGNGIVLKNDKTYVLQSQYIYVIDARNAHIVYPQPINCETYIRNKLVLDADTFLDFCVKTGMSEILYKLFNGEPVSTAVNGEIDKIFKTVCELCASGKAEDIAFAHGYITELIHWIYSNSQIKTQSELKKPLQKMLDVINEKDGVTSLSEISEILHLDKHYLCRLFKEKTGTNLSSYLSDKVFGKSRKLLESTTYSMEEIAQKCGFSSSAALSRFFKNKCGIAPSEYRKERELNFKLYLIE